ncbi:hypothetical protein B0H16DRAFT_1448296 [Mycena metata]|uniref:Uncharacterized protein n=1 Tax=Mycena metata TaxID=1033252 RepID=A0AAD7KBU0_9AGAR|nr:hypothetical protein B0H16DRAFT_1448296 [Mycena metata]
MPSVTRDSSTYNDRDWARRMDAVTVFTGGMGPVSGVPSRPVMPLAKCMNGTGTGGRSEGRIDPAAAAPLICDGRQAFCGTVPQELENNTVDGRAFDGRARLRDGDHPYYSHHRTKNSLENPTANCDDSRSNPSSSKSDPRMDLQV